jgi:isocitrate/isopropylmalate dehydrogenase
MFESIHGSAPDITGLGIANPVGTFWSAAEMLWWLGEDLAADGLMRAIERVSVAGIRTRDANGTASTVDVTHAVIRELQSTFSRSLD